MNPDGGAVPQTFKIASPDDKKSPSEPVAGEPATVALPKMGENPIPPKAVASSKISSRILGKRTLLHCGIKNAAMHLLKNRRHDYVDRHLLQTTSCDVRQYGEPDPRRRVPSTVSAVGATVSSPC